MRIALDTDILAYAEGVDGEAKRSDAYSVIERLPDDDTYVPLQVLGELFDVLVTKARRDRPTARQRILVVRATFPVIVTTPRVMLAGADLATDHGLSIWDAVILAAAASAGCEVLLSEDMQDGFAWSGVMVANPFAFPMNKRLRAALGDAGA